MSANQTKSERNEKLAREKATKQLVYISGLKGVHTLEIGVAYYYRGHYIYAYPAGNPIDPVPFATKTSIHMVGMNNDLAPTYDPRDPSLRYESSIRALDRSCFHEWESRKQQEERKKAETKKALEAETKARIQIDAESETIATIFQRLYDRISSSNAASYTPHGRGQYLAYSAPGSRKGSVESLRLASRPSSPSSTPSQSRYRNRDVRPVSSTSRLRQPLAEERFHQPYHSSSPEIPRRSPQRDEEDEEEEVDTDLPSAQDWMDSATITAFTKAVSRPSSTLLSSIPHNTTPSRDPDTSHLPFHSPTPTTKESLDPTLYIPLSNTSRPRAASQALNKAYNAANTLTPTPPLVSTSTPSFTPSCPLHDASCDAKSVSELHATLHAQMQPGFWAQRLPMKECEDGRVMIDWAALRDEEMGRRG